MRLVDKILYLTFNEMVESGVSADTLKKAKERGTKCWRFINDPDDNRKVLIAYEELKDIYKKMVAERYGNPYDMVARQPILDMILQDPAALQHYKDFRYGNNQVLPLKTIYKYTRAASWLTMLLKVQEDRQIIKKQIGLTVPEFYMHAATLIDTEKVNGKSDTYTGPHQLPGDFPSSYQRLMNKVKTFGELGYPCLIANEWGNKAAAKLGKTEAGHDPEIEEKQMRVIRRLAMMHNNMNAAQVHFYASALFKANGWKEISVRRIKQIMEENKRTLTPGRMGKRHFNSNMAMQVKREAPKYPTYYFTLDGWTVELLYQEGNTYNNRLVVVVVLDAFNKYPVGYAIGERENAELIKQANRNALQHLHELFGDHYYPYQVQSDRYAIKTLTPFYQAMAHMHTPAAVGNAKAKIIEPYFKYLNQHYCQRLYPQNWSGHNVTASRKNQVNAEMLDMIKKNFPDKEGVMQQIHTIMATERKQKLAEYLQAWEAMPAEHRMVMSEEDRLMVFGQPVNGRTNRITGQGISKQIGDMVYVYDSFDPAFRDNWNTDWLIIADLPDVDKVLAISPDNTLRFLLHRKQAVAMDARSITEEQRKYLSEVQQYNKNTVKRITDIYAQDAEVVDEIINNTPLALGTEEETALKLMLTTKGQQKEAIQDAKRLGTKKAIPAPAQQPQQQSSWAAMQQEYMKNNTNIDQYLD